MPSVLLAAVLVGTWNGNWFPSGRAEHRANDAVEEAAITAAAKMFAAAISSADPSGTNDLILCLNEIRGPRVASNLVSRIGRKGLRVVSVSGYRRRDRFDYQQDVIATTLPVVEAHWSRWRAAAKETPPRGYAFAAVVVDAATTANVYAVHLKSNYGQTTAELKALNRAKRTHAVMQLVEQERPDRGRAARPVLVAGDMNADKWRSEFAEERFFSLFEEAGFVNVIALFAPSERWTYPNRRHGNSALDYIFCRGFSVLAPPFKVSSMELSDHWPVFVVLGQSIPLARF